MASEFPSSFSTEIGSSASLSNGFTLSNPASGGAVVVVAGAVVVVVVVEVNTLKNSSLASTSYDMHDAANVLTFQVFPSGITQSSEVPDSGASSASSRFRMTEFPVNSARSFFVVMAAPSSVYAWASPDDSNMLVLSESMVCPVLFGQFVGSDSAQTYCQPDSVSHHTLYL